MYLSEVPDTCDVEYDSLELPADLRKRCLECWRLEGYCKDAPTLAWGENCVHLKSVGIDIRRKLAKQRTARGE